MSAQTKMSFWTFVGVTMALCANVRSIPSLAAAGWQLVPYLLFAIVFVAMPMTAMCGELSSMYPGEGGLQLWVQEGLGKKMGLCYRLDRMGTDVPRHGYGCQYPGTEFR